MAANNNDPAPPAINSTDTDIGMANKKDAFPLEINTDLPPDTKNDAGILNNIDAAPLVARDAPPVDDQSTGMAAADKGTASSATNTDAVPLVVRDSPPVVDKSTGMAAGDKDTASLATNTGPAPLVAKDAPSVVDKNTGMVAGNKDTASLATNTDAAPLVASDAPQVVDKNTGMVAGDKDTASSATDKVYAAPTADEDETGQKNAIRVVESGIGDANSVDSKASSEKKENNEGTHSLDEVGIKLTKLSQEVTEAAENPSINTDAPAPIDSGINITANNEDAAPPAVNSSDNGENANNKDVASPPATDKDTSMAVNNKDNAPPANNADAAPPAVDNDLGKRDTVDAEGTKTEKKEKEEEGTPTLDKYGTDLTKLAQEGKLTPCDGIEELVDRVIQILCRKTKCNPCLIGHPGIWKTAVIEGLARRIHSNNVPERLKEKKVLSITSKPESETHHPITLGEKIVAEIKRSSDILVYLDESLTLNSKRKLKHSLGEGGIQCIGATYTVDEYTRSSSLARAFQKLEVPEPSMDDTMKTLKGLRESYENHHKVHYTDEAFAAALKLSSRYISDGILLETAIDIIDEAGSRVQFLEAKSADTNQRNDDTPIKVTKDDVQHVVSSWTGIPVHDISKEESERLLKLEERLHESIIGQHEALIAVSDAIRRARVGLKSSQRPIASFIFTGPTGVGKTEVAKALAREYFGSEESMVRFDMSEYMERHSVSKLIGSPPGYVMCREGGQLTEAIKRKSHTVVLFDEIEKAHSDIMNIMLQILEDGRLTDGKGVTVKFSNTIIIMTSNVGSNVIYCESSTGVPEDRIHNLVMKEIKKSFRPEFLNRFDEIIVFKQLTKGEVSQIADLMFKEVGDRLKAKEIKLNVSDKFRMRVINDGYSPSHGARQLRRVITSQLENLLAKKMLSKEINEGDSVLVDVDSLGNIEVLMEPSSLLGE